MQSRLQIACRIIAVLVVLIPTTAWAGPGDGLTAGNLVVSPGVTFSTAFDTNVFRLASSGEGNWIAAPSVRLVPSLTMSSINGDLVDFRMDAQVGWQQYIPIGDDVVLGQSGLSADAGADLTFNRAGAVSFALGERLQRTNEPPPERGEDPYNRLVNRLGATLGVHPGGRVFQHYLSYDWMVNLYDEFPDINKQTHDFTLKNYWRFLPKTAAVLNGDFQLIQYAQADRAGGQFANVNSTPLRVTGGLSGLITNRLSLRLLGGWGWGFYSGGTADFSNFVLDTQAAFMFGSLAEKNKLFLGYERNFQDSTIANFASYHRPYAGYEQGFMNRRLRLTIRGEAMIRDYVGAPTGTFTNSSGDTITIDSVSDLLLGVNTGLDFNIYKWWSVGARYAFKSNFTSDVYEVTGGPDVVREYMRHLISISTTVRY